MKKQKNFMHLIMKYLKGKGAAVAMILFIFAANIVLKIVAPNILSHFIDSVDGGKTFKYLTMVAVIYMITILVKTLMQVCESYFGQKVGREITISFKRDVLKFFLSIDMKHHEKWTSGEIITRLDEDVEGLYTYFYVMFFKLLGSIVLMGSVLVVLGRKNIFLAGAMLVFCIIAIVIYKLIQDYGSKLYVNRAEENSKFRGFMKEKIDNIIEICTNNAEKYSIHGLNNAMKKYFKKSLPAGMMYSKLWSASTMLEAVATALFLLIAVLLWNRGIISIGTVYLVYAYCNLIYDPLQDFRNYMNNLEDSKAKLIRVEEMLSIKNEIEQGKVEIEKENMSLSVKNLRFAYEDDKYILNDVSFNLKQGESLGIVGETGCGKTTLVKLISRLYDFNQGEILLKGVSIKELSKECLRKTVGYCTQDVHFLHGNLRDNITLFDSSITDEQIYIAVKKADLEEWFDKFPEGLNTVLDMGADSISAGEAQLISILRLFLKDSSVIILDEISSHLDTVTEHRITSAIDILSRDRIVISIAHKISALKHMDKVIMMDKGKIMEYGGCNHEK